MRGLNLITLQAASFVLTGTLFSTVGNGQPCEKDGLPGTCRLIDRSDPHNSNTCRGYIGTAVEYCAPDVNYIHVCCVEYECWTPEFSGYCVSPTGYQKLGSGNSCGIDPLTCPADFSTPNSLLSPNNSVLHTSLKVPKKIEGFITQIQPLSGLEQMEGGVIKELAISGVWSLGCWSKWKVS